MAREPEWTKQFSNETVCNFYYYLSVAILVIGFMNLFLITLLLMNSSGKNRVYLTASLLSNLIILTIAYFIYLFLYLMCTRSLNK